jgi:hypothetical protein
MRKISTLVTLLLTLAGVGLVTAGPAAAEYPTCTKWTTYYDYTSHSYAQHLPSVGLETGKTTCQLKQGNKNDAVKVLQRDLRYCWNDTNVVVDGEFGPKTRAAVLAVQRWANGGWDAGLDEDGEYGPATRQWLMAVTYRWPANTAYPNASDPYCNWWSNTRVS